VQVRIAREKAQMLDGSGSPWRELLTQFGIDPTNALAGFGGAVVNVLRMKVRNAMSVLATAVSGTLIAVYLGEPIAKTINFLPVAATSFLVGYLGVQVMEGMSSMLRQRLNGRPASSPAPKNGGPNDAAA
jgi:hypothetical protein